MSDIIEYRKELYIRLKRDEWRENPMLWLKERMGEDPKNFKWSLMPEYKGHKWDGDADALSEAFEQVALGNWVGIEAATGTSKTYFLSRLSMWFLDTHEDALVITSAPKQDQLKLHLWAEITKAFNKFKKIRPAAELYKLRLVVDGSGRKPTDESQIDFSESWQMVGFVAGAGTEEESATKAQGFHRENMLIILEETPGMPRAVMTAFQNTCTGNNNIIMAVGNPDSELDLLHEFCSMKGVKSYRISAYDYPNVVLNKEIFKGAVTRKSIQRRKDKYGEEHNMFLSRVRGISPKQNEHSLIKLAWINNAFSSDLEAGDGYNALGVDVANSEAGDKAALAWGRGCVLEEVHEFNCENATHLAYNIAYDKATLNNQKYTDYNTSKMQDYDLFSQCIGIDAVGVGVSTVNAFTDMGMEVCPLQGGQWEEAIPVEQESQKPMYKFKSLRAQMYWELREDLRLGRIRFNITHPEKREQIQRELTAPRVIYDQNSIAIEKKEDIKRRLGGKSPNNGDAIAYWNWVRKGYRMGTGAIGFSAGS